MLVQRDDEGPVPGGAEADVDRICRAVAVERHDQLVPVKDRRDRQPMFTNELLVLPIPGDVPLEINRHDPAAVESGVHQIPVRHRRRGRMRVLGQLAGRGLMEQLLVPDDLATGSIKAKQAAGCPVRRRRGHNDAIFPDTGRRPCDPRDLGTPRQILVEAPGQRQVLLMRDTLASWPSEARPVLAKQGLAVAQAALSAQRRLHRSRILVIIRSLFTTGQTRRRGSLQRQTFILHHAAGCRSS